MRRVRSGRLLRPLPGVLVDPSRTQDWHTREVEVARAVVIGAIRRRRAQPAALVSALELNQRLPGRAQLLHLVELADGGSPSEFEIWGLEHLLDVPGLPPVERQYALETAIGTIHLDGACPDRLGVLGPGGPHRP